MNIKRADLEELEVVKHIVHTTIKEIYPHYYPRGVVKFFLNHHSENNIQKAIETEIVLLLNVDGTIVGTGSVHKNEINRVFVLPKFQGLGYGTKLLEDIIEKDYSKIILDSSLPAYNLYHKHGYLPVKYEKIITSNKDVLCFHTMEKLSKGP
ncbi:GNAT family N-acetyltransferase [Clostridium intestinale]|uniref:Ribosomal protein S18 acetylase RimI n=1 Tax=Clostridium intestinale DSM 6191 TaxID=1121320 RepID=A0A1M5W5H0_9CLOT|nr:GNAT family N-acetyltransferase [Clostridium intestinale]SHH82443.1 Ribosomal protein S18 acetylase RimI [Clostridium intestinale DSM 6191]